MSILGVYIIIGNFCSVFYKVLRSSLSLQSLCVYQIRLLWKLCTLFLQYNNWNNYPVYLSGSKNTTEFTYLLRTTRIWLFFWFVFHWIVNFSSNSLITSRHLAISTCIAWDTSTSGARIPVDSTLTEIRQKVTLHIIVWKKDLIKN